MKKSLRISIFISIIVVIWDVTSGCFLFKSCDLSSNSANTDCGCGMVCLQPKAKRSEEISSHDDSAKRKPRVQNGGHCFPGAIAKRNVDDDRKNYVSIRHY